MKNLLPAVVVLAGLLVAGCSGPRMSVPDSCEFLKTDTFAPTGNAQQQAEQVSRHYQEVADKVAPEIGGPIQKMADIMKQVAAAQGTKTDGQTAQLIEQNNKIGEYCK